MKTIIRFDITIALFVVAFFGACQTSKGQSLKPGDKEKVKTYKEQISRYRSENNIRKELEISNKIGFIYWQNNMFEPATNHFERCLIINEKLGNRNGIKLTSYYLGMIYSEQEKYSKALEAFQKGVGISRDLNLKNSILSGLINIAQTHQMMGNYDQSSQYAQEALAFAKELDDMQSIRTCYGLLSENYKELGDSEKSIKYFDLFSAIDQHLKNEKISEIQKSSQNQVKQARADKQKTEHELTEERGRRKMTQDSLQIVEQISRERQMQLELKELEIQNKQKQLMLERTIRNFLIAGFILIAGFFVLLFIFYRQKKKANKKLEERNHMIQEQNKKIQEQRDTLEIQNTKLNDSLSYAENIQEVILPDQFHLKKEFDVFILYRPKDIVSGDFYWFAKIYDKSMTQPITFLAVVDCTGHGVPGAFMSMIGNRIFNEIISEKRIMDPSEILVLLNKNIVEALKQEHTDNTDGMDVCLISIQNGENNKKNIKFAGAKRPLYLFKKEEGNIQKIKGDRYSIGGINKNRKEKEFTSKQLTLEKGDILYLTTDGIFDQVNNTQKRFSSQRFLKVLNENINKSLAIQQKKMEQALDEFQQDSEQRDDITVIGAKII